MIKLHKCELGGGRYGYVRKVSLGLYRGDRGLPHRSRIRLSWKRARKAYRGFAHRDSRDLGNHGDIRMGRWDPRYEEKIVLKSELE